MRLLSAFRLLFPLLLFTSVFCSCSSRRNLHMEDGWELLGWRKVNFVRDVDVLPVTSSGQFSALRFKVENREMRLNRLKIYFENGDVLEPNVSENYVPGEESRYIELGSQGRAINRIEFRYRTMGKLLKGRARVYIYGRRAY